ncbi:hypothetical protein [endosymbiont GvMRE of Glomus versiforme]|uniref:hypothetical protein n=1 Tax=endosymbiont GvMRE of Glomus versiforme TaxID=2039283 RepID=UPI000EE28A1C|nr:hypothetical protein [endosymbiont GvMRE of Glomus versiforme]RHZ37241.1 hypothetical protein GvMRE_I1g72 [endosymbiont GvMRE of Glomus versiforme]
MKKNVHNYELLCLFSGQEEEKKANLVKNIQNLNPQKLEIKSLKTEKLVWPVEVKNYLLLHLAIGPEKVQQIEKILQQSPVQHLLINSDREKKLKIKKPNSLDTPQENISNKEEQIISKEE